MSGCQASQMLGVSQAPKKTERLALRRRSEKSQVGTKILIKAGEEGQRRRMASRSNCKCDLNDNANTKLKVKKEQTKIKKKSRESIWAKTIPKFQCTQPW